MLALVCITAQRLYSVHRPTQARSSSVKLITGYHFVVWVVSVLALLPFIPSLSSHMVTKALISKSAYFHSDTTEYSGISEFANRLSGLINGTKLLTVGLQDVNECLELNFAAIKPNITSYFGYYSVSGVCLPKFYRTADDMSHFNMMSAAIICFNFCALIFIAASYASIYVKSTSSVPTQQVSVRGRKMQRKITILILTDVTCWLPICVMSLLSMGSIVIPSILYAVSAIILLPINSSLNPVIYTDVIQKVSSFLHQVFVSVRNGLRNSRWHLKALVFLYAFEESVDCHLLSSFCDDWNLHISLFKYVLSTMDVSTESISKFLIGNRFHVKLRILSPYSRCFLTLFSHSEGACGFKKSNARLQPLSVSGP